MFSAARQRAKDISSRQLTDDEVVELPLDCLPEHFSFTQIADGINIGKDARNPEDAFERLLVLNSCLSHVDKLQREEGDDQMIHYLSVWTDNSMLSDGRTNLNYELSEDPAHPKAVQLARRKGFLGLSCISALFQISSEFFQHGRYTMHSSLLISVIAFTSSRDPWTTPASRDLAQSLLSLHDSEVHSKDFIINDVVQVFIRPLFSKSKPEAITTTGRKAMPNSAPPRRTDVAASDRASRPWKFEKPYAITVFSWAVDNASEEIITDHWNMFIPPLLTLLDTPTTPILIRGLETLSSFLPKFSSKLLQQTGLGEVFEDAVMPTLLYLPSITPKEESIQILPAAFEALFILAEIRYPDTAVSTSTELSISKKTSSTPSSTPNQRIAFLDRMMRKGILTAHLHASNYYEITTILLTALSSLLPKMGVNCVKHLKDIFPVLIQTLTDPFGASRPEGLREGMRSLKALVLNAWPRMGLRNGGHGMEVVRILVVCWRIVGDAQAENQDKDQKAVEQERVQILEEVKREIVVVGRLLVKAIEAVDNGIDVKGELKPLFEVDDILGDIFDI